MVRVIKLFLSVLLLNALMCVSMRAQTLSDCNSSTLQAALNAVSADNTTITLPAGACTWTTAVTYNQVYSTTIIGATTTSGAYAGTATDSTVIIDHTPHSGGDAGALGITTASGKVLRLSGITFEDDSGSTLTYHGVITIGGGSHSIRVDHCHFLNINVTAASVGGFTYGVWDHNLFDLVSNTSNNGPHVNDETWNGGALADGAWSDTTSFGSIKFWFFENNTFEATSGAAAHNPAANDCGPGGRQVFRYNVFNNTWLQTHPTGPEGAFRGCRATEIYNNTFNGSSSNPVYDTLWFSSGTLLLWGNSIPTASSQSNFVTLHSMRRNNSTYAATAIPNGWGYCGTSFDGVGSAWDQNSNISTGYHCLDQPGMGQDGQALNGQDFPNRLNIVTGTIAWPQQAVEPIYEWLNTVASGITYWSVAQADAFFANADYYLYTASFTGASGTGSGLLSARPATCAAQVAYWATDTNTLYQCDANAWKAYYQPYMYPHPLTTGQVSGTAPTAPTGLTATVH